MNNEKEKNVDFTKLALNNPLIMYNHDEVAFMLGTRKQNIAMYREIGILKAVKTGKRYMFSGEEIQRFQKTFEGYDISNRIKALEAVKEIKSKN